MLQDRALHSRILAATRLWPMQRTRWDTLNIAVLLYVLAGILILLPKQVLWLVASAYALYLKVTNQLDSVVEHGGPLSAIGIRPQTSAHSTMVWAWRLSGVAMLAVAIYMDKTFS